MGYVCIILWSRNEAELCLEVCAMYVSRAFRLVSTQYGRQLVFALICFDSI